MKQQYKIVKNPKTLSDEEIDRHKNFSSLLNNYEKVHKYGTLTKPFLRNFGVYTIVMVAGVVILMLLLDKEENDKKSVPTDTQSSEVITSSNESNSGSTIIPDSSESTSKIPEVVVDKSGKVTVASNTLVKWKYSAEFESGRNFIHQFENGIRVLVDANSLLDKAGNSVKGKMELLYRDATDFSEKISVAKNSIEFEIKVREKSTGEFMELSSPICVEIPLKLTSTARAYHWSAPKARWQPTASELKFRFDIHTDQVSYKVLENHIWELSYEDYKTYTPYNFVFGKNWRQFEWNKTTGLKVKGSATPTEFNAAPARLFASPDRQKQFVDNVYLCFTQKSIDTCSGKTRINWKANNIMLRSDISTVSINTQRTGLFLVEYELSENNATRSRTLNIISLPTNVKGNLPDNYNP